jgi:beta-ureidopropionase
MERRSFLQKSVLGGAGISVIPAQLRAENPPIRSRTDGRLPREVWIASISYAKTSADSYEEMVDTVLEKMEFISHYQPDIICLPELFPFFRIPGSPAVRDVAEQPPGKISSRLAEYAGKHGIYVICPIYTESGGKFYNSSVLFDRQGAYVGQYNKIHPTVGEMENGVSPGSLDPPVFKTDFGIIGMQICFDIEWEDGWKKLREMGAEMVIFSSAYGGGITLNSRAWQNKYVVVSSVVSGVSRICDITGEEVASTGRWNPDWAIAPVNLEKAFLHTWPFNREFKNIQAKYGRSIRFTHFDQEEWSILESLSPEIKIADILEEFGLKTHEQHIGEADAAQKKRRVQD